jgi:hypothetical protein
MFDEFSQTHVNLVSPGNYKLLMSRHVQCVCAISAKMLLLSGSMLIGMELSFKFCVFAFLISKKIVFGAVE